MVSRVTVREPPEAGSGGKVEGVRMVGAVVLIVRLEVEEALSRVTPVVGLTTVARMGAEVSPPPAGGQGFRIRIIVRDEVDKRRDLG